MQHFLSIYCYVLLNIFDILISIHVSTIYHSCVHLSKLKMKFQYVVTACQMKCCKTQDNNQNCPTPDRFLSDLHSASFNSALILDLILKLILNQTLIEFRIMCYWIREYGSGLKAQCKSPAFCNAGDIFLPSRCNVLT